MKKIEAIVFDWAGTTVDYGCFAPVAAFLKGFSAIGITLTEREVRGPMGMTKIDHIGELFRLERVTEQFTQLYGRSWNEEDVLVMNSQFEEYLFASLSEYTTPINGVMEVVDSLRKSGYKIGSTTGYTSAMMDVVIPNAAAKGYSPDCCVTSNNLPSGRPAPYMVFQNMIEMEINDPKKLIKVGDTVADILEGVNSGVWTIGVVLGSSDLGLTQEQVEKMPKEELLKKMSQVRQTMYQAGAHYVIDTMTELPAYIEIINQRMNG